MTVDTKSKVAKLLKDAPEDTQAVITEVFKIERERLYQAAPRGLSQEIARAIKERIK